MTFRPALLAFLLLTFAVHAQTPAQKALITAIGADQKAVASAPVASLNPAIGKLNTDTNALIATITVTPPPPPPPPPPTGTLPLDAMGGTFNVAACYSFRACSQAAITAGRKAYQLSRDSDAATLDIGLLANGSANDAAAIAFCAPGCHINIWYDQSGADRHQRQVPKGFETPIFSPKCFGGVSCMFMSDFVTIRMLSNENFGVASPQPYSASYVARFESVFNNDQFIWGTTCCQGWRSGGGHRAGGGVMVDDDDNYLTAPMPDDAKWHAVQNVLNGGSSSVRYDASKTTGSITTNNGLVTGPNTNNSLQIGSSKDYGYIVNGSMAEVILFNATVLTDAQQTNLCNSQKAWAGTPGC